MQQSKTCATCKRGKLSSNLKECVDCLKRDNKDNRFPNWNKETEEVECPVDLKTGYRRMKSTQ